jgi:uncharacterized protein YndB with AHSA1/START domain
MASTRLIQRVNAPRRQVYRALLDSCAIATWMVPNGMTSHVHLFDAHEGGSFRVSLTYDSPTGTGKTSPNTDTYHGRFVKLVPNQQLVEVIEFETADLAMRGEMMVTFTLTDADNGTDVLAVTKTCHVVLRQATMKPGGVWHSRSSRSSSRGAHVTMTPNHAFSRTRRYGPSTWQSPVAARRLAWLVGPQEIQRWASSRNF